MISIELQNNFTEITLQRGCFVNLRHIFRTLFAKNTSGGLLLQFCKVQSRQCLRILQPPNKLDIFKLWFIIPKNVRHALKILLIKNLWSASRSFLERFWKLFYPIRDFMHKDWVLRIFLNNFIIYVVIFNYFFFFFKLS